MLTLWFSRSGAPWSGKHTCFPRHSLAVHSSADCCPMLISSTLCSLLALFYCLLSTTFCSSKSFADAGAGAATARCMAACMELLAWTQLTQARGTPAWQEPHNLWNKQPCDNGTTCVVRAHWEGLDLVLLGHWLPNWELYCNTVYCLLTSFFSSSLACSPGIVQTPAASSACCMQLWCCIVLGFAGLRLACNICTPSRCPRWLNLHCKPAIPLPKETCCCPHEGLALPWTWGYMPSVPRFICGSPPLKVSAKYLYNYILNSWGQRWVFHFQFWHALYLKNL